MTGCGQPPDTASEKDRASISPAASWQWTHAQLEDGALAFAEPDGFERACADGFFFVSLPDAIDLSPGDRFARSFYRTCPDDPYCGFTQWTEAELGEHQGFYRRTNDQTEQFFLESRHWEDVYPPPLARQAKLMREFALQLLRAVLARLSIPEALWDEATGQSLSGRGTYTLTFNHFRPEVRARGLNTHKDSGWVTVLRSHEPGLEVLRNGAWRAIDPIAGSAIVNFGCAMEILTKGLDAPVSAVAHRVVEQPPRPAADRFSYGLFVDSSLEPSLCPGLFRYDTRAGLILESSFKQFLSDILAKTYASDTEGLYDAGALGSPE